MQAAMAKRKKHSRAEMATKLAQANELATQGKLQSEVARRLGVSVMTLHRWRKAPPGPQRALVVTREAREPDRTRGAGDLIAELQLENSRIYFLERLSSKKLPRVKDSPRKGTRRAFR